MCSLSSLPFNGGGSALTELCGCHIITLECIEWSYKVSPFWSYLHICSQFIGPAYANTNHLYCKLVETFHVVSECNTAVYFSWCSVQALAQSVQLFWPLVTFGIANSDNLTDLDLQLFTETEQDQTRHSFIQYLLYVLTCGTQTQYEG